MKPPTNREEYDERFDRNYRETGTGENLVRHLPCPFCAAAGWHEDSAATAGQTTTPILCVACGRSAQIVRTEHGRSQVPDVELVQVAGPDAPAYMDPAPRRVEYRDTIDPLAHRGKETGKGRLAAPPVAVRRLRRGRQVREPRSSR